jgi:predicted lipid carrier protein YhbT
MTKTMYDVLSPDGIPITCEPFKSQKKAAKYGFEWCKRFEQQGYYSTSRWEKIPVEDLPHYLDLVRVQVTD